MKFVAASSVDEAVVHLAEFGDETQILAGGTDVMIQYMRHEISPSSLLYIGKLDELDGFTSNATASFGALTTHRRLATDPQIAVAFPALAQAGSTVGGWQTQEVGTLGGNLCNASPAADTAAPLLVADASVELRSLRGSRHVRLEDFLLGRRETVRRPEELLTAITAEPLGERAGEVYMKLGRRSAMEVAIVGLAVRLTLDEAGEVSSARIAICSVAPKPYRAIDAEQVLEGSHLEREAIVEAGRVLAASATPIDDARASAVYRKEVLPGLLARAIETVRVGAGGAR